MVKQKRSVSDPNKRRSIHVDCHKEASVLLLRNARVTFEKRVKRFTDGCWGWTGFFSNDPNHMCGYFLFTEGGTYYRTSAHQASYVIHKGSVPDGKIVYHTCLDRSCVSPKHLRAGTWRESVLQRVKDGRHPRGERNGRSKLSEKDVVEIRRQVAGGKLTKQKIADRYGVDPHVIRDIRDGHTWTCVS